MNCLLHLVRETNHNRLIFIQINIGNHWYFLYYLIVGFYFYIWFLSSFAIYLRLCVIMGLNWIIEGIFMLTDINATFEMVLDMCNALTGVYIFGLFVLKPSVLHLIKKRFVECWYFFYSFCIDNNIDWFYSRWQLWFGLSSPSGSIGSFTSWVPPENFVVDVKQRWMTSQRRKLNAYINSVHLIEKKI